MNRARRGSGRPVLVASARIGMMGVSFGMARYGFGLLAPDIRAAFGLSSGALGVLSAASYVAYIAASVSAAALVLRIGARAVVMAGGIFATVGMLIAAGAESAGVLFAGLLVAGASAGLAFPPFSEVAAGLAASSRSRVLTAISAGTGWGVALAAPIALLAGQAWRVAWLGFAAAAALATLWAVTVLPARVAELAGSATATTRAAVRRFGVAPAADRVAARRHRELGLLDLRRRPRPAGRRAHEHPGPALPRRGRPGQRGGDAQCPTHRAGGAEQDRGDDNGRGAIR